MASSMGAVGDLAGTRLVLGTRFGCPPPFASTIECRELFRTESISVPGVMATHGRAMHDPGRGYLRRNGEARAWRQSSFQMLPHSQQCCGSRPRLADPSVHSSKSAVRCRFLPVPHSLGHGESGDDKCRKSICPPPAQCRVQDQCDEDARAEASIEECHRRLGRERLARHLGSCSPLQYGEREHGHGGNGEIGDAERRARRSTREDESTNACRAEESGKYPECDRDEAEGPMNPSIIGIRSLVREVADHDGRSEDLDYGIESKRHQCERPGLNTQGDRDHDLHEVPAVCRPFEADPSPAESLGVGSRTHVVIRSCSAEWRTLAV